MATLDVELEQRLQANIAEGQCVLRTLTSLHEEALALSIKTVQGFQGQINRLAAIEAEATIVRKQAVAVNVAIPDECKSKRINITKFTDDVDTFLRAINHKFYSLLAQVRTPGAATPAPQTAQPPGQKNQVRLPKLELPKFSGTLTEWSSFYSMFKVSVHENASLTPIEKFTYLLSSLSGEALSLVKTLDPTAENYGVAWDLLESRYKSEKRHIYHHFGGLLDLPEIKNSAQIPQLLTKVQEHKNALTSLKIEDATYGPLLVTVLTRKLSPFWQRKLDESRADPRAYPTLEEFIDFLKDECSQALDNPVSPKPQSSQSGSQKSPKVLLAKNDQTQSPANGKQRKRSHGSGTNSARQSHAFDSSRVNTSPAASPSSAPHISANASTTTDSYAGKHLCGWCERGHQAFRCPQILNMSPSERMNAARKNQLCFNCLGNHDVGKCESRHNCFRCGKRHHTILCEKQDPQGQADQTKDTKKVFIARIPEQTVVLPTARVLLSANGHVVIARALLDSCADVSIVTTRCAQLLHLKLARHAAPVAGLDDTGIQVRGSVEVDVSTLDKQLVACDHRMLVSTKITGHTPSVALSRTIRARCRSLPLADPDFDWPGPVDMLIGADLLPLALTGDSIKLGSPAPVAWGTLFGYVVLGPAPRRTASEDTAVSRKVLLTREPPNLSKLFEDFCAIEDVAPAARQDPTDEYVENFYTATTTQGADGRYCVRLPFKPEHPPLGTSLARAEVRFRALERRFEKEPEFHAAYKKFMQEYENNGFMSPAAIPPATAPHYFIPHHAVVKESSSTTKLRVVFDASAPTSTKVSLNQVLLPGPKLQTDIRDLIINFRKHPITLTADIQQMYLYINIHPSDAKFQMILWRPDKTAPVRAYTLNTVTFGVNCSPFLAIRTTQQTATDYGQEDPDAAKALTSEVYVDNLLTGASTVEAAKNRKVAIETLASKGGFRFRKWTSNDARVLEGVPAEDLECPFLDDPENPRYSLLGLHWASKRDLFTYLIRLDTDARTKRGVLSVVASIYDPCGWLSPVVLGAKTFIKELWNLPLDWDTPLPPNVQQRWDSFTAELSALTQVTVPRLMHRPAPSYQIHGFCDASICGYAAALYLRSAANETASTAKVSLIIAKTRVAPKKEVTIPRLELCAAVLLTRLFEAYLPLLLDFAPEKVVGWSDSTIVLSWIASNSRLDTFVANRVGKIRDTTASVTWKYVPSESNPSDPASRGIPPSELPAHPLWWEGPPWLTLPESEWPPHPDLIPEKDLPGVLPAATVLLATVAPQNLGIPLFSTWTKTVRVMAYVFRFFSATRLRTRPTGILQPAELAGAESWILKATQEVYFAEDFKLLGADKPATQRLRKLHPFIDSHGLLRVGGRLRHSALSDDARMPIVIPGEAHIARLIVTFYHRENLHAGPQLLQSLICRKFWILNARRLCRQVVHQCLPCFKARPRQVNPLMGDLPPERVLPNPPFLKTGMDYAGPFKVKIHQLRSARVVNVYLCIFVCLCVKAVHIEVVHDLTTVAFLAALSRFIARRGCPSDLFSDCGTQFVGAKNALYRLMHPKNPQLLQYAYDAGINFHFNPPAAPHQGGIWESAVKSAKFHLARAAQSTTLVLEEFQTLSQRIEAMLNSRPLTPLSSDPLDLAALTPGHFLIGRPLAAPPETRYEGKDLTYLHRWNLTQALAQQRWRRWSTEYLCSLQPRKKWTDVTPSLEVGSLVLIHDPHAPPLAWRLGRVSAVFPGADKHVRVAEVTTATGEYKRPVHKLYPLPVAM
ncbi:uncharacterized protein [Bemisia tabaci]|uniref:uncharacterized protein n=1 Tax=Bemisia tabaci TaxID=7038 RepID=UPI003B284F94